MSDNVVCLGTCVRPCCCICRCNKIRMTHFIETILLVTILRALIELKLDQALVVRSIQLINIYLAHSFKVCKGAAIDVRRACHRAKYKYVVKNVKRSK